MITKIMVKKPFDLEKAKAGEALITRDGRRAVFVAYNPTFNEEEGYNLIALVYGPHANELLRGYYSDGSWYGPCDEESDYDLSMWVEEEERKIITFADLPLPWWFRSQEDGSWFAVAEINTKENYWVCANVPQVRFYLKNANSEWRWATHPCKPAFSFFV